MLAEQAIDGAVEALAELEDGVKLGVDLAALDKADLAEIQTGLFGQLFLGEPPLRAGAADIAAECF